jgi:quercetin dioxygenase-like cupin family protein
VEHWNLHEIETPSGSRSPVVVHSQEGERRVVLIGLDAGQSLDEHQVKESALLLVLDGTVHVEAGDESVEAVPGTLLRFAPDERHSVTGAHAARLLLLLAPWPGEGHYRGETGVSASAS